MQLSLILTNTIAVERGDASVYQCGYCGAIICTPNLRKPTGSCPACDQDHGWWKQETPVGPFRLILSH